MKDPWCSPLRLPDGSIISGGAARNRRISVSGGMQTILTEVYEKATRQASGTYGKDSETVVPFRRKKKEAA